MTKKKYLKNQDLTWKDIEDANINISKLSDLEEVSPKEFFQDSDKVAQALFECINNNDAEGFKEISDTYSHINRFQADKKNKELSEAYKRVLQNIIEKFTGK